ncbi:MAG TPA: branched-chain amino acid ABC transporter permease [Actinomycetota bacterium]|nr:branched-chain amino acid ABC transporter permease [Actinomycetota bacterium]
MSGGAPVVEIALFGLSSGAVFGLLALGLVLIYRTTGIMNFAHWAIGLLSVVAYIGLTAAGIPGWGAVIISLPLAVAAGVGSYRLVFRKVSRANQIIVILIAIAVAQLFSSLAAFALGFDAFTRLAPWLPVTQVTIAGAVLSANELITAAAAVAIAFGFLVWFRLSTTGRALRAVAQNPEAAMLAGIDEAKYSQIAWGIGSALAGLSLLLVLPHVAGEQGGVLTAFEVSPLGTLLIPAFGAALVGGLVNMPMALVGGFVFGLARELLILAPAPWNGLRSSIAAILIVVLLLLRTERFFTVRQEREALEA